VQEQRGVELEKVIQKSAATRDELLAEVRHPVGSAA